MRKARGFTLIELIVVMTVIGMLAGIVSVFIRNPMEAYMAGTRRAELVDIADTALAHLTREVHGALPNSLRVTLSGGAYYLEFLPVQDGGRYRAELTGAGTGNVLDFTSGADSSFDVLGPQVTASAGQYLVIYNLGLDASSDAWQGDNRRTVTSVGSVATLAFTATGAPFPLESPGKRFYLTGGPVSYVCDPAAGTIRRYWGYALQSAQPTSFASGSNALLASRVKDCRFAYDPGAAASMGQLTTWIQLENAESGTPEQVSLYRELAVNNDA
ncbi:MAG: prepilin-type N-terminal cleavage/methylation domain-containing protein [Betaproteobacteria bacterium]|nr:prepilin-type N-terminal cleavage/methylation domain-containing protein [Betaproteobacteria bacterium]